MTIKARRVPPPTTPRPLPPPDPSLIGTEYDPGPIEVDGRRMSPFIPTSAMTEKPYCSYCGSETVPYWKAERGYNAATGKRNGRNAMRCPFWRWWRPWHESQGWVLP